MMYTLLLKLEEPTTSFMLIVVLAPYIQYSHYGSGATGHGATGHGEPSLSLSHFCVLPLPHSLKLLSPSPAELAPEVYCWGTMSLTSNKFRCPNSRTPTIWGSKCPLGSIFRGTNEELSKHYQLA